MSPTPGLAVVDSSALVALLTDDDDRGRWVRATIALAELLDAPLVTLDRRLAQAHGPRCAFLVPPA